MKAINDLKIIVDEDDIYQSSGWARKMFNRLLWFPFANRLPNRFGIWFFTKSSEHTRLMRQYAKTYMALELMYGYEGFRFNGNGIMDSLFTWFWEAGGLR